MIDIANALAQYFCVHTQVYLCPPNIPFWLLLMFMLRFVILLFYHQHPLLFEIKVVQFFSSGWFPTDQTECQSAVVITVGCMYSVERPGLRLALRLITIYSRALQLQSSVGWKEETRSPVPSKLAVAHVIVMSVNQVTVK
jgi:hypothetical protein